MSNVVNLSNYRRRPTEPQQKPVCQDDLTSVIIDWAIANGIDVFNNERFSYRLADFAILMKHMAFTDREKQSA